MKTRIYVLTSNDGQRLVRAANQAQAIKHVAALTILCRVADQDDLVALAPTMKVENAGVYEQPELPIEEKEQEHAA